MKYFLLSLLSYFVYHNIIAPLFQSPPNNPPRQNDSTYYKEQKKKPTKSNDDFVDYEEIK